MSKIIDLKILKNNLEKKKLFMTIIFVITLLYIIYAVYLTVKTPTDTVRVESGVLTSEESTTGYIIRDEEVVKGNNFKNGISQILLEEEKAAKNQPIFRYYGENEKEIQEKVEETNQKIQEALKKENVILLTDIKNLESQIDAKINDLKTIKDTKILNEYKKQLSDILLKKATITGENSKSGSYIKKLIQTREEYEKQLVQDSEYVVAPKSGIVSYRVDGLEDVLKAEDFEKITANELENLDIKTGKIILTSNEEAKVVNNFECYIAVILENSKSNQAEIGKNVVLTLSSGSEINATIEKIIQQEDNKTLVFFKVNTLTTELIAYRKISVNITWWSVSGIKVPNDAILEDESGKKYVIKKTSSGNKKSFIKILKTNDKYSIIGSYTNEDLKTLEIDPDTYVGINVYDNIIMYPKK